MKTGATIIGLGLLLALPVGAQEVFFYPSQGQGPEQQSKDRGECHAWAVQQTGFDPASPPPPPAAGRRAAAGSWHSCSSMSVRPVYAH